MGARVQLRNQRSEARAVSESSANSPKVGAGAPLHILHKFRDEPFARVPLCELPKQGEVSLMAQYRMLPLDKLTCGERVHVLKSNLMLKSERKSNQ